MRPIEKIEYGGSVPLYRAQSVEQILGESARLGRRLHNPTGFVIAGVVAFRNGNCLIIQDPNEGASIQLPVPDEALTDGRKHAVSVLLLSLRGSNGHHFPSIHPHEQSGIHWSLGRIIEPPLITQPELLEREAISIARRIQSNHWRF